MSHAPVNGLQILAFETTALIILTLLAVFTVRFKLGPSQGPRWLNAILEKNWRAVLVVIVLALVGRALLLPTVGIPQPHINDEYSYLLMGDTFAHGRLTNPTPPLWQHFETFHVNFTPTYHSKYAVSQGVALAVGQVVFHQPWIGIYLSTAMLCGAICWALQAFLPPGWAFLGGLIAVLRIALFSYWMNSYWGGSIPALAGALALGAVVRLFQPKLAERSRLVLALLFALALLLLANSRPYEGLAFSLPLILYFAFEVVAGLRRREMRARSILLPVVCVGLAGLAAMGYYNQRTTGNPLVLPHLLNERTYSPLPLFLWQAPKPAMQFRDPVFARFFAVTEADYGFEATKTFGGIVTIEVERFLMNWFFYCGIALLFPAIVGFFSAVMRRELRLPVFAAMSTFIAIALCTYTLLHYASPATITFYLFSMEGLRYLWSQGAGARAFVLGVCMTVLVTSLTRETGSAVDIYRATLPDVRDRVIRQLDSQPGKQIVLVSYDLDRHYPGDELVHNWADFDAQKILWARSKGTNNDAELCSAYADRTFWTLMTDDVNYSLKRIDICGHTQ